jgi:pimeloyl-ACP methyl ester carboxylesterase
MRPSHVSALLDLLRRNPLLPANPSLPDWAHLPGLDALRDLWRGKTQAPAAAPTLPTAAHRIAGFPHLDYPIQPGRGDSGRVLVLLRGINTAAEQVTEQAEHWRYLVDGLADLYSGIVYFSYNAVDPEAYTETNTHHSLWHHHRPLLYNLLASCYDQGYRSFDLVGHSLGGVVATEYLILYGLTGPQAGWVRHVVTLDSPVNGSSRAAVSDFAYRDWYADQGIQSMLELADLYLNRDHYERVKLRILNDLRASGIVYWNLTSVDDWVVPVEDAILASTHRTYHLGRALRSLEPSVNRGHAQVYQSPQVRHDLRLILGAAADPEPGEVTSATGRHLPARMLHAAGDRLNRFTDPQLVRLGMLLTVMHYTYEDSEPDRMALVRETVQAALEQVPDLPDPRDVLATGLQRVLDQARHLYEPDGDSTP